MNSRSIHNSDLFERQVIAIAACWIALNIAILSISSDSPSSERSHAVSSDVLRKFKPIQIPQTKIQARLMRPDNLTKPLPLIVYLHGSGERGSDNWQQLQHFTPQISSHQNRKDFPCYVFAPQCPENQNWTHFITELETSLNWLIETEMIDRDRIYLTGLSMGGYGTWKLAVHSPELFAALAPVCGGGNSEQANRIAHIPTWVVHGVDDNVVPISQSKIMVEAIHKSGGNPIFTQLPETGHNSWTWLYNNPDFLKWLFTQEKAN